MPRGTLRHTVLRRNEFRMTRSNRLRKLFCKCPDLLLQRPAHDRHINVDTARAASFGIALDLQRIERLADDTGCLEHLLEPGVWDWIEIEVQIVRPVEIVTPRVPRVQINAAEVHDPQKRGDILD